MFSNRIFKVFFSPDDNLSNVSAIDTSDERKALDSLDGKGEENEDVEESDETEDDDSEEAEGTEDGEEEVEEESEETDDEEEGTTEDEEDSNEDAEGEDDSLKTDSIYQQLKAADKDIFKKVPELRSVIFREREYTNLFPDVKQAQEAKEQNDTFVMMQNDVMSGNPENLFKTIYKTDEKAFEAFASNLIPTVEKVNRDLYLQMVAPEIKKLFRFAVKSGDERLITSAKNLHWFAFGDSDIDKDAGLKPTKIEEAKSSDKEQEWVKRALNSFSSDVTSTSVKRLSRYIEEPLRDSGLPEWTLKNLVKDILQRVDKEVSSDKRHMGNVNTLWQRAKDAGFTNDWKDRIINAYLSRAKVLISKHRKAVLSEAKLSLKTGQDGKQRAKRIPSSSATVSPSYRGGPVKAKDVDWNKADERAMLDGKIPLRK